MTMDETETVSGGDDVQVNFGFGGVHVQMVWQKQWRPVHDDYGRRQIADHDRREPWPAWEIAHSNAMTKPGLTPGFFFPGAGAVRPAGYFSPFTIV
jgi:hypothetical protein